MSSHPSGCQNHDRGVAIQSPTDLEEVSKVNPIARRYNSGSSQSSVTFDSVLSCANSIVEERRNRREWQSNINQSGQDRASCLWYTEG